MRRPEKVCPMRTLPRAAHAAFVLALTTLAHAEINPKNFDPEIRPQDDFYRYANGAWLKNNPVPAEESRWGGFSVLQEDNQKNLHTILERAAAGKIPSPIEKLVGDFYASGMDEAAIEAAGTRPLAPEFARIAAIKTPDDIMASLARFHRMGVRAGFGFYSGADAKNSNLEIAQLRQGGLSLPDRDYYLHDDEKSKTIRTAYVAHVTKMFGLLGDSPAVAEAAANAVLTLETKLATASLKRVLLRNPYASYHKMPVTDLAKTTGELDWAAFFKAVDAPTFTEINLAHPDFYKAFATELNATPVGDWQYYLRWHLLRAAAPHLSSAFVNENFAFYSTTLNGVKVLKPRWKRIVAQTDSSLGEALGQLYVAEYFPPEAKARVLKLVADLRAVFRARLETLDWMDETTRTRALAKLDAFTVKMGYPDKWKDYSAVVIDRGPYVLNVFRAAEFEARRNLQKIGKAVDKTEWGMTPPTVNAYFSPSVNGIAFPAGILQPPFFDPKADDAVNYGGIGTVIGHEITHGFDDQGRQYDAQGNLTDWWTPESAAKFKQRAAIVVKQFAGYSALPGLNVNGELTLGENIADLGGVKVAYAALQRALADQVRTPIDGFTPEQRFFLSWATIWRNNIRPENLRVRVMTDTHSPGEFRANGPLTNLDEFAAAFGVPEGAAMRRTPAERVTIW